MPVYNAELFIGQSISSVVNQTFRDWELIVVDDFSTDNSVQIIKSFQELDKRIHLYRSFKKYSCPGGPRNYGVQRSSAPLIAFLDADDLWHPQKLEIQLQVVKKTNALFSCTSLSNFSTDSEILFQNPGKPEIKQISFMQQLIKYQTPTSSVLCSTKILLQNPFNTSISYKAREDLDCFLRCLRTLGSCVKITNTLVFYRMSKNQISKSKLEMLFKHFYVLYHLKLSRSKVVSLFMAILFTFTHFFFAIPLRVVLRRL